MSSTWWKLGGAFVVGVVAGRASAGRAPAASVSDTPAEGSEVAQPAPKRDEREHAAPPPIATPGAGSSVVDAAATAVCDAYMRANGCEPPVAWAAVPAGAAWSREAVEAPLREALAGCEALRDVRWLVDCDEPPCVTAAVVAEERLKTCEGLPPHGRMSVATVNGEQVTTWAHHGTIDDDGLAEAISTRWPVRSKELRALVQGM
jgi:hypothetical protein